MTTRSNLDDIRMDPTISFIVTTIGRSSIDLTLRSIRSQLKNPLDQIIIIGNTSAEEGYCRIASEGHIFTPKYEEHHYFTPPGHNWGAMERTIGMAFARCDYLMFVDDDDMLLPGAVRAIKQAATKRPDRPLMFKMIDANGLILWITPEIKQGNHGGPQFITPNVKGRLGAWTSRYECDFDFCTSTLETYPEKHLAVIWCNDLIYGCREYGQKLCGIQPMRVECK